jgi:hypothetical protein
MATSHYFVLNDTIFLTYNNILARFSGFDDFVFYDLSSYIKIGIQFLMKDYPQKV